MLQSLGGSILSRDPIFNMFSKFLLAQLVHCLVFIHLHKVWKRCFYWLTQGVDEVFLLTPIWLFECSLMILGSFASQELLLVVELVILHVITSQFAPLKLDLLDCICFHSIFFLFNHKVQTLERAYLFQLCYFLSLILLSFCSLIQSICSFTLSNGIMHILWFLSTSCRCIQQFFSFCAPICWFVSSNLVLQNSNVLRNSIRNPQPIFSILLSTSWQISNKYRIYN